MLKVTQKIKSAILKGKVAGVVFYDFTDAFGNVNRQKLIKKLWKKYKIRGKLFLHLHNFLIDRTARIRVNNITGEWKVSNWGTSAGTVLGAILFLLKVADSRECVDPKYADDFTTIVIGDTVIEVETKLQNSINELVPWAKENDMLINQPKTKAMLFGKDVEEEILSLEICGQAIEQKSIFPYLGVTLDSKLSFSKHIESICSKALGAMRKLSGLFKKRRGISVKLGLLLYQALVRPHLEYAAPVWAGIAADKWKPLEKVQQQCLKKVLGAHSCSSSAATEVISGIMPLSYRTRELCIREYVKISSRPETD